MTEVNAALAEQPELVNREPYGAGWMLKVKVSKLDEMSDLMDAAQYDAYIATL